MRAHGSCSVHRHAWEVAKAQHVQNDAGAVLATAHLLPAFLVHGFARVQLPCLVIARQEPSSETESKLVLLLVLQWRRMHISTSRTMLFQSTAFLEKLKNFAVLRLARAFR